MEVVKQKGNFFMFQPGFLNACPGRFMRITLPLFLFFAKLSVEIKEKNFIL